MRIEDTDRARAVDGAVEVIIEAMKWLGLDWDEGPDVGGEYAPYKQSERLELYFEHAERLVEAGFAYKCYCSPERLDAVRKARSKTGQCHRLRPSVPRPQPRQACLP